MVLSSQPRRDNDRSPVVASHTLVWLALRWETYIKGKLGRRVQVVDHTHQVIRAKFRPAFERLAAYLDETGITANEYFTLLLAQCQDTGIQPFTNLLGGRHFNNLVEQQRAQRRVRLSGSHPLTAQQSDLDLPIPEAGYTPPRLALDTARLAVYRRQYHWFEWGRFWLFFANEFSGAFLSLTSSFVELPRGLRVLTPEQAREWRTLDDDPNLARKTREHYRVFQHRVGALTWNQESRALSLEQLAVRLLSPPSSRPLTG